MELELKFMVEKSFEPRLRALGYKAGQFCRQLDTYYIVDETIGGFRTWLRIREDTVNKSASIGLRRLVSDNASEKTETVFAPEDAGKMKQVMAACGKKEKCVVDKQRKVFTRGGVTVTLDDVRNLGRFVEIGIEGEENEADIARLNAVVAEAGLELSLRIGADYPELLMKRKKR
ncbi:MAG: CYTH domain-containing protein [Alphaproteobacteria bacterium]|jgi:predicted adenylyl cyclase CyaB